MGFGIKKTIKRLIGNSRLNTQLTVNYKSRANINFGYDGVTESTTSTATIDAVPANYVETNLGFVRFGDLQEGESRFFIDPDVDISEDDDVVLDGITYDINKISAYWVSNEKVAQIIVVYSKLNR